MIEEKIKLLFIVDPQLKKLELAHFTAILFLLVAVDYLFVLVTNLLCSFSYLCILALFF